MSLDMIHYIFSQTPFSFTRFHVQRLYMPSKIGAVITVTVASQERLRQRNPARHRHHPTQLSRCQLARYCRDSFRKKSESEIVDSLNHVKDSDPMISSPRYRVRYHLIIEEVAQCKYSYRENTAMVTQAKPGQPLVGQIFGPIRNSACTVLEIDLLSISRAMRHSIPKLSPSSFFLDQRYCTCTCFVDQDEVFNTCRCLTSHYNRCHPKMVFYALFLTRQMFHTHEMGA